MRLPVLSRRQALVGLAALAAAPACRLIETPLAGTVKLGLVAPFSGRDYQLGYNLLFAVKQALKEFNLAGGAQGWRVELVAHDDRNEAAAGIQQARKLTIDPDVVAVIGHPGSASATAALPEYRRAGMPFLTLASADPLLDGKGGVVRLGPSDTQLAGALLDFLPRRFNATRLAIAITDPANGRPAEELVSQWWKAAGSVVFGDTLPREPVDYLPFSSRLVASAPEVVFYAGGIETGGPLYAEIRRIAPGLPFVASPAAASPGFARLAAGSPTDHAYLTFPAADPVERNAPAFVQAFRAAWGLDPLPQAGLAYEATLVALAALSQVAGGATPPTRQAVRDVLPTLGPVPGLGGPVAFDPQGQRLGAEPAFYRLVGPRFPGERQPLR
ncbi:MAG: branched-chain amino acid ABC transporter substrate-binding protein [Chloroflexi bacterium]|nr:branched-chain amino acid ABC transporter substrate-binding protein [Chloroflexota bacterium]